jgi:hypothetical protein
VAAAGEAYRLRILDLLIMENGRALTARQIHDRLFDECQVEYTGTFFSLETLAELGLCMKVYIDEKPHWTVKSLLSDGEIVTAS